MHIEVKEEKCSGCRLCQQICAIQHFKEINPKKSSINIRSRLPAPGGFTPKVCDRCGECADVCLMGAIELKDGAYAVDADLPFIAHLQAGAPGFGHVDPGVGSVVGQ